MQIIEGIVCYAKAGYFSGSYKAEIIFGEPTKKSQMKFRNLQNNGIIPYQCLENAEEGLSQLVNISDWIESAKLMNLHMKIFDCNEKPDKEDNLIIIIDQGDEKIFLGPRTKNDKRFLQFNASLFFENGLKPYSSYCNAAKALKEIRDQRYKVDIASFLLTDFSDENLDNA
jgi:hypothetical protein